MEAPQGHPLGKRDLLGASVRPTFDLSVESERSKKKMADHSLSGAPLEPRDHERGCPRLPMAETKTQIQGSEKALKPLDP